MCETDTQLDTRKIASKILGVCIDFTGSTTKYD